MPNIKFLKEKKEVSCQPGENLRRVARREGVQLYPGIHRIFNCQGFGQCGSCRVLIKKGGENVSPPGIWERIRNWFPDMIFYRIGVEKEMRLACLTRVNGDCEVETQPSMNWHGEKFWG
jgi:ferredoxin